MIPYMEKCPQGAYEIQTMVSETVVDENQNMKISELARLMEKANREYFDLTAGISKEELDKEGICLVIVWSEIEIFKLPKLEEKIRLRVWAGKDKVCMHSRKFVLYSMRGETLAQASSLFVFIDRHSRNMVKPPSHFKNPCVLKLPGEMEEPLINVNFPKSFKNCVSYVVDNSLIDKNNHVNNSYYLQWGEELLDAAYRKEHNPKHIWIKYNKEILENEAVKLHFQWDKDTMFLKGTVDDKDSFLLKMEF